MFLKQTLDNMKTSFNTHNPEFEKFIEQNNQLHAEENHFYNDDRIAGYILDSNLMEETSLIDYTNQYQDINAPGASSDLMMTESKLANSKFPRTAFNSDKKLKSSSLTSKIHASKNNSNITVVHNYDLQEVRFSPSKDSIAESEVIDKRSRMHTSSIKQKISELSQKFSKQNLPYASIEEENSFDLLTESNESTSKLADPQTNVPLITSNVAPFSQQLPLVNTSLAKYESGISFAHSPADSIAV